MRLTIEEIRELIALVGETGIGELEVQRGENRVRIRQSFGGGEAQVFVPSSSTTAAPSAPSPSATPALKAETPAAKAPESSLVYAKSPIVGTFYEASSPDTAPFVRIGEQHVTPGKVLCIIESMKLMERD